MVTQIKCRGQPSDSISYPSFSSCRASCGGIPEHCQHVSLKALSFGGIMPVCQMAKHSQARPSNTRSQGQVGMRGSDLRRRSSGPGAQCCNMGFRSELGGACVKLGGGWLLLGRRLIACTLADSGVTGYRDQDGRRLASKLNHDLCLWAVVPRFDEQRGGCSLGPWTRLWIGQLVCVV